MMRVCAPRIGFVAMAVWLGAAPLALAQARHPHDALTWDEHWAALQVLRAAGKYDDETRFNRVTLKEPDKAFVLAWRPGQPLKRAAEIVGKQDKAAFEAVVDLEARRLVSWSERPGMQAAWLEEDFKSEVIKAVRARPEFIDGLKKRGVADPFFIDCVVAPPSNLGEPAYRGRRVGVLSCRPQNTGRNPWVARIEGLIVTVDLDSKEILEIADDEVVPLAATRHDYSVEAVGPPREFRAPIEIRQPLGPGFSLDGHVVSWDRWRFHVRPDHRAGLVLSTVVWRDGDRERPVLYQGHLSEIFVPYMDPRRDWASRTFIDLGEFTAGGFASSLVPGIDCPDTAAFVNGVVTQDDGRPKDKSNVACLFERYTGDVNWRHGPDGRPKRELVVRMTATVGNYDYIFDWIFQSDGQLRIATGATGIVEAKMARAKNAASQAAGARDDAYGRFIDDHVVGVNHDHYFSFRLDVDVDGQANTFVRDQLVSTALPPEHRRRSIWTVQPHAAQRERDAQLQMDMHRPSLWRVTNPAVTNRHGYPTSYQLMPGMNNHHMMAPDDLSGRRAGFIDHHLWVTPYSADERYAAGDFPTLSTPGQGLPQWTAANRPIENTDVVLWYTFGMHHVVRAEDWPVMPVLWHDVVLRPFDFFDRNPAIDTGLKP
jgi:primary-amine oxidase